jgi:Amt family ammonium transporter
MSKRYFQVGMAASAALLALAAPALAQDAEAVVSSEVPEYSVFVFNTTLFLIGGFLVMWMAAGFAMLEAGLVRSKNVAMQCTKNISLFSIAAIAYYLIGYNLMYPLGSWSIGTDETGGYLGAFGVAVLEAVGVGADAAPTTSPTPPPGRTSSSS